MPFFSFAAAHAAHGVRGGVAIYALQDLNISAHGNALQHIYFYYVPEIITTMILLSDQTNKSRFALIYTASRCAKSR